MIAFFAATPYQLLACMQIRAVCFPQEQADLFLLNFNTNMEAYKATAQDSGLFRNTVSTIEPYKEMAYENGVLAKAKVFLGAGRYEITKILQKTPYDIMFSTCIGLGNVFYYTLLRRKNPAVKFAYYDEGVGNYCENIAEEKAGKTEQLCRLLGWKNPCRKIDTYWVYRPEWIIFKHNLPVRQIPPMEESAPWLQCFRQGELPQQRYIYLDSPHQESLGLTLDYGELVHILENSGVSEQLCTKLHPVQKKPNFSAKGQMLWTDRSVPWELVASKPDMQSKVLISICSTAAITPYMLFGQKTQVILLYKLFQKEWPIDEAYCRLFETVKQECREPIFHIPETWPAFAALIREMQEQAK